VLSFDNDKFIASYRAAFPVPSLNDSASSGLKNLLGFLSEDSDVSDIRWAAYMLATAKHECANTWMPIEEYGKGQGKPYGQPVVVTDQYGTQYTNTYYGRGFVQLTWKLNYDRMGQALGLTNGLVLHPEHALEPATAYRIMSYGMRNGSFTGKGFSSYIQGDTCDYLNARRIINGLDQAQTIQDYAQALESILNLAKTG
jgi:hypothetical protein